MKIRLKKNKPFFDDKTQLDLNCLWISALISSHDTLPKKGYLNLAESFFINIEKKYLKKTIQHSYSKEIVFLEDYAYAIAILLDLSDQTLKTHYLFKAKDLCKKTIELFYVKEKSIFQKNIIIKIHY